jgi:hypothetical protein
MMNQQPDKLFREKLESLHRAAPVSAWEKIDAGLAKKNHKGIWLKAAAAVLVFATATFILWPENGSETPYTQTAENKKIKKEPIKPTAEETKPAVQLPAESVQPVIAADNNKSSVNSEPKTKTRIKKEKAPALIYEQQQNDAQVAVLVPEVATDIENPETVSEEITTNTETLVAENSTTEEDAVTLVYTAEEVNEKYLDKDALAKATSSQKKSSTFRKLLDKAYDLKNNQDPLGGLRQKKNEILALNFKNEKRSQNK